MKVAVLGGGHGCYAAAAELSEAGHEVWFWRRDAAAMAAIQETGGITVTDRTGTRIVPIAHPTASLADAVSHAEIIVIPLPATVHDDLGRAVAPHLHDGQIVFLPPGTLGTIVFARAAALVGNKARVTYAETGTLPYLVRKSGPQSITVSAYASRLPTGFFPAVRKDEAFAALRQVYPSIEMAGDVLSGCLMNAGPIIHPPLIVMNAGPLEHFPAWDIHNEGTQASIRAVTTALDQERMDLRETLGYGAPHFPLADYYRTDGEEWMYPREAKGDLIDSSDWREKIDLHTHRYMREDSGLGLSLLTSIGRWAGFPMPLAGGLLAIASAITGDDLYATGRTLESLDLATLTRSGMTEFLHHGY
jgi:opine dehydrogenase